MPELRRSGVVTSATYANSAGSAAAESSPPSTRAASSCAKVWPNPNRLKPTA